MSSTIRSSLVLLCLCLPTFGQQKIDLASNVRGVLPPANGGFGTALAFSKGDILCALATGKLTNLGAGTNGDVLTVDSTQTCGVKWVAPTATAYTGTLPVVVTGTVISINNFGGDSGAGGTKGAVPAPAAGDAAAGKFLGAGGSWAVPAGGGNTTSTSLTSNRIPKANGANSIVNSSVADDGTTVSTAEEFNAGKGRFSESNTTYVNPNLYSQLYVTNTATTGSATQTQIGFGSYDGSGVNYNGWVGVTSHTFSFAPYADSTYLESFLGSVLLLADDATNGHIKFFTGGYTTNAKQRMTIFADGVTAIGTQGVKPVSPAALNVQALGASSSPNIYALDSTGLYILSSSVETTKATINTSYESGGSEIPLILGTFTNRANQIYMAANGGVGILNSSPTANTLDITGGLKVSGTATLSSISGSTQCLHTNSSGVVSGSGADCAAPITAQTNVLASRTLGTVYQNSNSTPLFVTVTARSNSASASILAATDSSNPPTTYAAWQYLPTTNNSQSLFFIVMPGNYYKVSVNVGVGTADVWMEWH